MKFKFKKAQSPGLEFGDGIQPQQTVTSPVLGAQQTAPISQPAYIPPEPTLESQPSKKKTLMKVGGGIFGFLLLATFATVAYFYATSQNPKNVYLTNATDRSVTISWVTDKPDVGQVIVSEKSPILGTRITAMGGEVFYDDRDYRDAEKEAVNKTRENIQNKGTDVDADQVETEVEVKKPQKYHMHHVTIKDLDPSKKYYFQVGNGKVYKSVETATIPDSSFTTIAELEDILTPNPAYGQIKRWNQEDTPVSDGIIYMTVKNKANATESMMLSAVLSEEGSWYIDLANAKSANGMLFSIPNESDLEEQVIIETGPYGVYSKPIPGTEDAPAKVIQVAAPETETSSDKDLKYEGNTLKDETTSSLINKSVFAADCSESGYPCSKCEGGSCETGTNYNELGQPTGSGYMDYCKASKCASAPESVTNNPNLAIENTTQTADTSCECGCDYGGPEHCGQPADTSQYSYCMNHRCETSRTQEPATSAEAAAAQALRQEEIRRNGGDADRAAREAIERERVAAEAARVAGEEAKRIAAEEQLRAARAAQTAEAARIAEEQRRNGELDDKQAQEAARLAAIAEEERRNGELNDKLAREKAEKARLAAEEASRVRSQTAENRDDLFWEERAEAEKREKAERELRDYNYQKAQEEQRRFGELEDKVTQTAVIRGKQHLTPGSSESCSDTDGCFCRTSPGAVVSKGSQCPATEENTGNKVELIKKIFAQAEDEVVILSPQNGLIAVETDGFYCTEYKTVSYCFDIDQSQPSVLYIDTNNNNQYDESDEKVSEDGVQLKLTKEIAKSDIAIKKGFNLISSDIISESYGSMASDFLNTLNTENNDAFYSIAKFESGRWIVMGNRDGEAYGSEDFQIIPGHGYLLRAKRDVDLKLTGQQVIDPVPVAFGQGWNLVAVHGTQKAYTAEALLDSIDKTNVLDADNVTKWNTSTSGYEGLQKEADQVYGFDFPIDRNTGYFVRIVTGTGNWTPEAE